MRRFDLVREVDPSGVSGTGRVARGVEFDHGYVAMQWEGSPSAVPALFEDIGTLLEVHGHNGLTHVRWRDPPSAIRQTHTHLRRRQPR